MLLVVNQNIQIACLDLKLLGLIILEEVLVAIDKNITEERMKLDYFLKSAIPEASDKWVLVHSVVLLDDPILYVLLWFTDEELQVVRFLMLGTSM